MVKKMHEFIAINEQRAEFYWWMSSVFSTELTQDILKHYHSDEMANYYNALAMSDPLTDAVNSFRDALQKQKVRQDPQLELAADFCGLFLSTPKSGALPYASIYVGETGLLNDKPAQEMGLWMEKYAIAQIKDFNEPFDHLAVILDFMGNLVVLANKETEEEKQEALMQEQQLFLESMLIPWLPQFQNNLNSMDPFGFYRAAGSLLLTFVTVDYRFLRGE